MKYLTNYIIGCFFLLFVVSCSSTDPKAYKVDSEFEPYVQKFFQDAKTYGQNYDSLGLIMRFANLSDNTAGLCYVNRQPITIEIDRTYWNSISGPNETNIKEDLIFHEMGHGFTRRTHINNSLNNGDWKSIMCGDELPNGREPNINYRGFRKDYYIKELFTQTNEEPSWSNYVPNFSEIQENDIIYADAQTPSYWFITIPNEEYSGRIESNQYVFENKTETDLFLPIKFNGLDIRNDFYYEVSARLQSENNNSYFGISIGDTTESSWSIHYSSFNKTKNILIGESSCRQSFVSLYNEGLSETEDNIIALRKKADTLYYYQNGNFYYHNDLVDIPIHGNCFGFTMPAKSTVYINYAKIKSSSESGSKKALESTDKIRPIPIPKYRTTKYKQ